MSSQNFAEPKATCLFCKFIREKENKLFEDDRVYLFADIAPKADFHYLIIPKVHMRDSSHIRSFEDMDLVQHMIDIAKEFVEKTHKGKIEF